MSFSKLVNSVAKSMPSHKIDFFGSDSLLFSSLPYYVLLFIMVLGMVIFEITGNSYILLFIIYGLIPLVDQLITMDTKNPTNSQAKNLAEQMKFQIPLFVTVIVDWLIFLYAMKQYSTTQMNFSNIIMLIGFAIVISNLNAAQFAVSHQIMHKPGWRRVVGTVHMLKTLNMHFTYEHLYGHHRRVATIQDPATALKNENVYHFFVKSYFGAYKNVYKMQQNKNKPFYANYAVLSVLGSALFCALVFSFYGSKAFLFYLLQVLGAVFYLEVINFIQHYGLLRKKLANGQYEKVSIKHSWNAPHRLSNYLFFKLQRHSDHHQNAMKPYQTLLTIQQSPQLPHGYIVMTVMALFPGIFKRIMNPLVEAYNDPTYKQSIVEVETIAIIETRKFVIEISLCVAALFFGSFLISSSH